MLRRPFALLLVAALVACGRTTPDPVSVPVPAAASPWRTPTFPGSTWEVVPAAESAGYRSAALDSVTQYLKTLNTTGLVVVASGRVLYSYGDITEVSYLASARKSLLSMLYGNYVAGGTIRLDETLASIGIDDVGRLSDAEKQATVRDLLITSSGVYHPASNGGDRLDQAPPRGSQKPGTYFLYSNWDFNALGTIFETRTGRDIYDAFDSDIAKPIGMEDWDRTRHRRTGDARQSRHLAYHFNLTTRDMARVGYLMLRGGQWNGTQVVPADWARESTTPVVPSSRMNPPSEQRNRNGYAYLWWTMEEPGTVFDGGYSARGMYGQYITILPRLDMVVAHKRAVRAGGENPAVTWPQYMELLRMIAGARCGQACG